MYFAAKKLGRYQSAERPTTAIVLLSRRMRRSVFMSSSIWVLSTIPANYNRWLSGGTPTMYVEERMYTLNPGTAPEYLKHYQNDGMKVQLKHLPHMVGYYVTEVGTLNMIVHMWAYESLDQRERCRAAMSADPDWQAYVAKIRPLMKRQ